MAVVYKVLGQSAPLATTETDIYTVPAVTEAIISSLVVCNRSATPATFRISISVGGGATANQDFLFYDLALTANNTFTATLGIPLATTDVVRVYASTANISFTVCGNELT